MPKVLNEPRMLTPEEREALREDLRNLIAELKRLREEEKSEEAPKWSESQ